MQLTTMFYNTKLKIVKIKVRKTHFDQVKWEPFEFLLFECFSLMFTFNQFNYISTWLFLLIMLSDTGLLHIFSQ